MFNFEQNKNLIFNLIIAILIIAITVLLFYFFISSDNKQQIQVSDSQVIDESEPLLKYEPIIPGEKVYLPILNFHHIDFAPIGVTEITKTYYLEPTEFEQILKSLINNGYELFFMTEATELLKQGYLPSDKMIVLTFDDGNIDFYTNAWPILQKYNLKSSIYLMSGVGGKNYLNDEQIKELDQSGLIEIGSHTIYHPYLTRVSQEEQEKELRGSKEQLEELIGKEVSVLSYPFGLFNDQIKELTKEAGYEAGLTYAQKVWQDPEDLFELNRVSIFPGMNVVKFLENSKK